MQEKVLQTNEIFLSELSHHFENPKSATSFKFQKILSFLKMKLHASDLRPVRHMMIIPNMFHYGW